MTLQPSELAKLVTVAAAAAILSRNIKHVDDPLRMVLPLVPVVGVIAILVMLQPDLGTTMVIVAIVFLLVFVSGVKWRPLAATLALGSVTGLGLIMSAAYRRERFLAFLHPWADPKNTGYQIVQSLMALGSGHWLGVGIGASRQKWMFVPNAHTDFIFAIMGEETGLVGEIVVLALFAAFIFAGIRIAMKAPDVFGRLLAAGITGWIAFQAIVNMGSVTGLLPITGVPLPFVSYGGSSLVVSLMAVGVLVSIGRATLEAASGSRPASRKKMPIARAPRSVRSVRPGTRQGVGPRRRAPGGDPGARPVSGRVVIAGGGTAGHVFPGLSLARVLAERGHEVAFLGTERGMEARLVPEAGFEFRAVPAEPFIRGVSPRALRGPAVAPRRRPLAPPDPRRERRRRDGRLRQRSGGTGREARAGAAGAPRTERGSRTGEPHPGARVPRRGPRLPGGRGPVRAPGPVRRGGEPRSRDDPARADRPRSAGQGGRRELELQDTRRTVVIFGGSLGALRLNRAAVGACSLLADRGDLQLVLLTGPSHLDAVRQALPGAAAIVVRALPFLDRMDLAYAVADLVVSRAGAGTIAELSACGLPAVLVPYPHGVAGEQEANARSMERAGGAAVMLDDEVSAERLATAIEGLIDDAERLRTMAAASAGFGRPDAALRLADLVEEVAA